MFQALKFWKLGAALKEPGNAPGAFAAVLDLGRIGNNKAIDLLIGALGRGDGVSRSAARELGRLGDERAVPALVDLLQNSEVNQSAAEALAKIGPKSLPALLAALKHENPIARRLAAGALGEIADKRALDALIESVQSDDSAPVRIAAVTALGQIKDQRAIWVLVGTLRLRDETTPERQAALEELRTAASLAMRKIGDPLKAHAPGEPPSAPGPGGVTPEVSSQEIHPRLGADLGPVPQEDLVTVLKELMAASEEISWANLERRDPILPAYFASYDLRRLVAESIGAELHRRGGASLMKQVWEQQLNSYPSLSNWWTGIGDWQG